MISYEDRSYRENVGPNLDRLNKVREAYAVLLAGISITRYDKHQPYRNTDKKKYTQILWLDPAKMRLCCATVRPSGTDLTKGVLSRGIYMRDVADIIIDASAADFTSAVGAVYKKEACLTIVGSDSTISIEFPTKFVRDWLVLRLGYLVTDILTLEEKAERAKWRLALDKPLTRGNVETAKHLMHVLRRGIQVHNHHSSGNIYSSVLRYDEKNKNLLLDCLDTYILGIRKLGQLKIKITELVALRIGTHSLNFVKTKSTHKWRETFLIISTSEVFNLELISESARDIFVEKFKIFAQYALAMAYKEEYQKINAGTNLVLNAAKDVSFGKSFYNKLVCRSSGENKANNKDSNKCNEGSHMDMLETGTSRINMSDVKRDIASPRPPLQEKNDEEEDITSSIPRNIAAVRAIDTTYGIHNSNNATASTIFQPKRRAIATGKFRHTHSSHSDQHTSKDTNDLYNIV